MQNTCKDIWQICRVPNGESFVYDLDLSNQDVSKLCSEFYGQPRGKKKQMALVKDR